MTTPKEKKSGESSLEENDASGIYQKFLVWFFYGKGSTLAKKRLERKEYIQETLPDQESEKKQGFLLKDQGVVLTDIDLPFIKVLIISFKFLLAGLVICFPIWIIFSFLVVASSR